MKARMSIPILGFFPVATHRDELGFRPAPLLILCPQCARDSLRFYERRNRILIGCLIGAGIGLPNRGRLEVSDERFYGYIIK
jgi:hypothetical protein